MEKKITEIYTCRSNWETLRLRPQFLGDTQLQLEMSFQCGWTEVDVHFGPLYRSDREPKWQRTEMDAYR